MQCPALSQGLTPIFYRASSFQFKIWSTIHSEMHSETQNNVWVLPCPLNAPALTFLAQQDIHALHCMAIRHPTQYLTVKLSSPYINSSVYVRTSSYPGRLLFLCCISPAVRQNPHRLARIPSCSTPLLLLPVQ